MNKLLVLIVLCVMNGLYSCNSKDKDMQAQEGKKTETKVDKQLKALNYLLDEVDFADNYSINPNNEYHFILIPRVGCPSCIRRFEELVNKPLLPNTFIFSEIEMTSEETPVLFVEGNLLMRLNLKTQKGMVYIKYRNEKIEFLDEITVFNIDSVVTTLML
jgi:thioredoxin-related protein